MVISTQVYVEHPDLALVHTIRSLPHADIGVVSDASTDPQHDVHYFWIEAPDFDEVEAALEEDHTVDDFATVAESDDRRTYRIEYSEQTKLISPATTEMGALTLDSRSHSNGWRLHLHLVDHASLYALDEYADERSIRLDVLEVQQIEDSDPQSAFGLTGSQIEALVTAYRNGYYDDPRETSLEEVASLLGVSRTAASGRLKRGSARLIEEVLVDDQE
ncbi:helix-turn-helix domain-containing protein [Halomicrococcus gelatinilyticus]|uniref:helix-turn-helix domain-containing protein n=1 Tax=Halomicrococcus gelatinilyticus TaxID=1702103 RepID=UPI002E0E9B2E